MNTTGCIHKTSQVSSTDKRSTLKILRMSKSHTNRTRKTQQFWRSSESSSNTSSNFPLEEIRHAVVTHQTSTENNLQHKLSLIKYGRARFATHIVTHHTLATITQANTFFFFYKFLTSIFFQIWRIMFLRRSDCTIQEIQFETSDMTSWPKICYILFPKETIHRWSRRFRRQ